jgi:FkbM family methyltransferase
MYERFHGLLRRLGYDVIRFPAGTNASKAFLQLVAATDVSTVVDVGANRGNFGRLIRAQGFEGKIVSFEPVARTFEQLEAAVRGDESWSAYHLGLGATSGRWKINVHGSDELSSLLNLSPLGESMLGAARGTETVDIARLDEIYDELVGAPAVVKLDTQGFDMAVVRGAGGVLDRIRGLQLELPIHPAYENAPDFLESLAELRVLGYELVDIRAVYGLGQWAGELDCLLIAKDRIPA